jgi:hypothetical protein
LWTGCPVGVDYRIATGALCASSVDLCASVVNGQSRAATAFTTEYTEDHRDLTSP